MSMPADRLPVALPLALGHEGAGTVVELGAGVSGVDIGANYVVYGPWGCGTCWQCAQENYCSRAAKLGIRPPGLGAPARWPSTWWWTRPGTSCPSATSTPSRRSRSPTPG